VAELRCPKCGGSDLRRVKGSRYMCRGCGYEFYACPVCGEAFEQKWQLASHMRKHRGTEEREVLEELRALRELLEEVAAGQKLILAKLDQVLDAQKEVLEKLDRALALLSAKPVSAPAAEAAEPSDEELPDFIKDNPWLSVLRSRGGGE
jgi:uncharacterized coiled-coil protein SlyX/predicted RNA-binding Zn-ribbon protein involved in translation (DUF1610 family)